MCDERWSTLARKSVLEVVSLLGSEGLKIIRLTGHGEADSQSPPQGYSQDPEGKTGMEEITKT